MVTLPETNIAPKNDGSNRNLLFQGSIFRFHVSFREGNSHSPLIADLISFGGVALGLILDLDLRIMEALHVPALFLEKKSALNSSTLLGSEIQLSDR